ncbi:10378_t:CDS:2 [Funneliformis caledonium]|uniref:10378_t:CDS:1 n=1 Tax=Funneliformis caledonium TaxID=1117310 RepID=A0A9N9GPY8_9GLOM|nr:10378_t:CDS:2 [Funneliformis caledonium]
MLGKILDINPDDSLILSYHGEILNYLGRYDDSISQFAKAYNIDPENTHILIKKVITHYGLQEYDEALLDLNKLMQLDPSYRNNEKTKIEVEKCVLLFDYDDNLTTFLSKYFGKRIYYLSNLVNLNREFHRFQEMDSNSLSGQVLSFEDEVIPIVLPKFGVFTLENYYYCLKLKIK